MSALKDAVLARGLVTTDDIDALLAWPAYRGASLAERLFRSGIVSDAALVDVFVGLGATDGTADLVNGRPPPAALGALQRPQAEKHRAVPLRVERSRLVVAMLDPSDEAAVEKLSFFCGLAVEPRAVRPRVLFRALSENYAVPLVKPDAAFLASRAYDATAADAATALPATMVIARDSAGGFFDPPDTNAGDDDRLPAPSPDIPRRIFGTPEPTADPAESPLGRALQSVSGEGDVDDDDDQPVTSVLSRRHRRNLSDTRPASSPQIDVDRHALEAIRRSLPPGSALEARDSLPPQVLRLLVPPLRAAILFLVRGNVAVGWDGRGPTAERDVIRDVLLPLTGPSTFERAYFTQRVVVGNAREPTTIERILWRGLLADAAPASFAVVPIVVGSRPEALLYVDRTDTALDDALVDAVRRAGTTLADGLAPFVAAGTLFPSVVDKKLAPIR